MIEFSGLPKEVREKVYSDEATGCWLWRASLATHGYAQIIRNGKRQQAHRFTYELLVGEIPNGLELDHLCRTRSCINPDHLEPVTHAENVRRGMAGISASNRAKEMTRCLRGHEYTPENTRLQPAAGGRVSRVCIQCQRIRNRKLHPNGKPPIRTHCRHGHTYDDKNTYVASNGKRYCRACDRLKKARKGKVHG